MQRVAFALPDRGHLGPAALRAGADDRRARARPRACEDVGLVLVTPEHSPLEAFGPRIASHIWSLLAERGIAFCTHSVPLRAGPGGLIVAHGEPVQAERIVSLPRLVGPWIGGLPHDGQGFLATDEHGAVLGIEAVWAAGDGTAFPLKQGGLAAQQAGAAAAAIARSLGADVRPEPFRPVLRGMLLDPAGPRFLDSTRGDVPTTPLWWPPTKVAAPHLWEYLAPGTPRGAGGRRRRSTSASCCSAWPSATRRVGEDALALRCLNAAAQVRGALPPDAAARREELAGAQRHASPPHALAISHDGEPCGAEST